MPSARAVTENIFWIEDTESNLSTTWYQANQRGGSDQRRVSVAVSVAERELVRKKRRKIGVFLRQFAVAAYELADDRIGSGRSAPSGPLATVYRGRGTDPGPELTVRPWPSWHQAGPDRRWPYEAA